MNDEDVLHSMVSHRRVSVCVSDAHILNGICVHNWSSLALVRVPRRHTCAVHPTMAATRCIRAMAASPRPTSSHLAVAGDRVRWITEPAETRRGRSDGMPNL
jgi:hypothetical protein